MSDGLGQALLVTRSLGRREPGGPFTSGTTDVLGLSDGGGTWRWAVSNCSVGACEPEEHRVLSGHRYALKSVIAVGVGHVLRHSPFLSFCSCWTSTAGFLPFPERACRAAQSRDCSFLGRLGTFQICVPCLPLFLLRALLLLVVVCGTTRVGLGGIRPHQFCTPICVNAMGSSLD